MTSPSVTGGFAIPSSFVNIGGQSAWNLMSVDQTEFKKFLAKKYLLSEPLQTKATAAIWRATIPENATSESLMNGSGLIVETRMHRSLFSGFTGDEVSSIVSWWRRGDDVLKRAEGDVGLYNRLSSSNYEKLFGKHTLTSDVGYESRSGFVKATIRRMRTAIDHSWYIEKDREQQALAGS